MPEPPAQQSVIKTFTDAFVKTSTIIGGLYVVRGYMRDRLDEVRTKLETEQKGREVLRIRFLQTQEDVSYTILALLPTLSAQVLQTMDVDAITRELQNRSRARHSRQLPQTLEPKIIPQTQDEDQSQSQFVRIPTTTSTDSRPSSSLSNIDGVLLGAGPMSSTYPPDPYGRPHETDDSKSDVSSSSFAQSHSSDVEASHAHQSDDEQSMSSSYRAVSSSFISDDGSATRSWVVESSSARTGIEASSVERSQSPAHSAISSPNGQSEASSVAGEADPRLSESILSVTTNTTSMSADSENLGSDGRSKAELWNEVKMLTFTRTLTTLYSTTLLSIFTTVQLTLLARGKYINAVRAQAREENMREKMEAEMSVPNLLWKSFVGSGSAGGLEKLLSALEEGGEDDEDDILDDEAAGWGFGWGSQKVTSKGKGKKENGGKSGGVQAEGGTGGIWPGDISEEVESKYLTMSWWLLHVGWKDVGERVRRGVEEVFEGVSLKTKLAAVDLHRLVADVRRRVEHEITFEGDEKKANFMSSLLPPTPEIIHHVLLQGGFTPSPPYDDLYRESSPHLELDFEFSTQSRSQSVSSQPPQPQNHHDRKLSDASISLESSELTHNFVNSPAMAVSSHVVVNHHKAQNQPETYFAQQQQPPVHLLDAPFLALIEETKEILSSADFGRVLEVCLDRATEVLFEGLEANVFERERGSPADGGENERVRLAGLLPGLARWSQLALEGLPNELVDKILNMREVSCLSAIAFAKFEEQFA